MPSDLETYQALVVVWGRCTCPSDGCDAEGNPGCALCRRLDGEWPCPHDPEDGWPRDVVAGELIDGSGGDGTFADEIDILDASPPKFVPPPTVDPTKLASGGFIPSPPAGTTFYTTAGDFVS